MEPLRSETGRFSRRGVRDARTLYAILRAVAEAAVADRPTADPRKVTVRQWRDARQLVEHEFGHIPLPQEIRRQLARLNGELLPFSELLGIAFEERGSVERVHTHLQSERRSEHWMSDRHLWYALRYVARSLAPGNKITQETTIEPRTYERERRRLIAADARKWKYGGHLADRLPSYRQITTYATTWDRALDIAQLGPRPKVRGRTSSARSVPVPEAIVRYYEVVGVLPTELKLQRFRKDYQFALAGIEGKLVDYHPAALALIAERGLPAPRPYEETRRLRVTWPKPDEDGLDPENPTYTHQYTTPQILTWVIRYVATLRPGEHANQNSWAAFASAHPGCPGTGTITNHGGLDALIVKARRPGALAVAEREHQEQLAAEGEERQRAQAEKPRALAVLAAMRELGGTFIGLTELAEHLGWNSATTGTWLDSLRTVGKVELVDTRVGRKSFRYQLTGLNLSEEELERLSLEAEARRPQPRRIMELLARRGQMPGPELAAELGVGYIQTMMWLGKLRDAGYVDMPKRRPYQLTESGRELLARWPRRR